MTSALSWFLPLWAAAIFAETGLLFLWPRSLSPLAVLPLGLRKLNVAASGAGDRKKVLEAMRGHRVRVQSPPATILFGGSSGRVLSATRFTIVNRFRAVVTARVQDDSPPTLSARWYPAGLPPVFMGIVFFAAQLKSVVPIVMSAAFLLVCLALGRNVALKQLDAIVAAVEGALAK